MELLQVDKLSEAIDKLYKEYSKGNHNIALEEVRVADSYGRILAEDLCAEISVPDFDRSTVDGYAVIAKNTEGANDTIPTFLNVIGESKMGEECTLSIKDGECVYVPTGGMVPKGADACVMIEHTESITSEKIAVYDSVASGKSLIKRGDDIKKGDVALSKGTKITEAEMGYMSSIGVDKVKVYKKWNITIISTGDELVDSGSEYRLGKIRDINTYLLIGLSNRFGFNIVNKYLLKDEPKLLEDTITKSIKDSDVVVVSGGSSKGKKDASAVIIGKIASSGVLTHGIAIRPGKPTITAYDEVSDTFIIGLPGHPVASAVLFKLIVVAIYNRITGNETKDLYVKGTMTENIPASPGRMTFQLVNIDENLNVKPIFGRSGIVHTLVSADGYVIIDEDKEGINKGDIVKVYYL